MTSSAAGVVGQGALIAIFLVAALSKILTHRDLTQTISKLGLSAVARPATLLVIGAELLAVTALTIMPSATWPRVLVVLLALSFAGAGIRALGVKEKIRCGCFGGGEAVLGRRQVLYLPLWLGLAVVAEYAPPSWSADEGLAGLATLLLALVAWKLLAEVRLWRVLRGDRMVTPEPRQHEDAEVSAA
ncbi:MauE/DoxX family redox-associated membrane protein [Streptosporangium amethystogenes]|uniref:MauE/DoxX family redox-associated membrane protein n=1 Tax=Streptosporangium amethystogenes TaxID=2002 RepID=UPI00378A4511